MNKNLIFILLLVFFFIGVLLGHYKPGLFKVPLDYMKSVLVSDGGSVYVESTYRLKTNFNTKATCGKKDQQYSFFVAGHVYGKPGSKYHGIYEPFKNNSKLNDCAFMPFGFLLGDTVVEASNYEFNILKNNIKLIGNKTQIHISPGNHDIGTGRYNAKRDIYEQNFGETYKYFKYENDLFILLDANLNNWNISGDQLQMLKKLNLGEDEYNNVFIFSHQVIWADANNKKLSGLILNSEEGKAEKLNFWNEVFPIIENIGKNVFVFAGDVGAFDNNSEFFYDNISGVNFFATGMGGGKRDNFLLLHIDHEQVNIELVQL